MHSIRTYFGFNLLRSASKLKRDVIEKHWWVLLVFRIREFFLIKIILISTIFFLAILGFSIYKAYYVSEQKTKQVNIYSLFVREYITRISQVQKLQNSKLLAKIRENIEM